MFANTDKHVNIVMTLPRISKILRCMLIFLFMQQK